MTHPTEEARRIAGSDPLTPEQRRDMALREEGAALERKRVVAWLRETDRGFLEAMAAISFADAIERLDHLSRQPEGEA